MPISNKTVLLALCIGVLSSSISHGEERSISLLENAKGAQLPQVPGLGNTKLSSKILVESGGAAAPLKCGISKLEKSEPYTASFDFDNVIYIVSGTQALSDGKKNIAAKEGDVVFIPKGTKVTLSTSDSGVAFYCANTK